MPTLDREPCSVEVPRAKFSAYDEDGRRLCKFRDWSVWFTPRALLAMPDYGAAEVEGKYMAHMAKYGPLK